jgi:GA-binding protein transcription factor, alpha
MEDWNLNGKQLCAITIQEFQRRVPSDPNDIFWTHLELLRKCKFVATIQKQAALTDYLPVVERQPGIHKKNQKTSERGLGNRLTTKKINLCFFSTSRSQQ